VSTRLRSGARWVAARVPGARHRCAARVPRPESAPLPLQAQVEALDDVERADLGMLVSGHLRVQGLAQQRPELAGLLGPVVEASRAAGRKQVERLLDGQG
jgi:hypothetical protein